MVQIRDDSPAPIYKQIVDGVMLEIKEGLLNPGDRLPTERELAAKLAVSRGTVKKAYKELADNNIIEVIQGSGSYVYHFHDDDGERRQNALKLIEGLLDKLDLWDFSLKEVSTLFRISMAKRMRDESFLRVAVIDCNPESLFIFKSQLAYIPNLAISVFMVESILLDDDPVGLFADYDLILTTAIHYDVVAQSIGRSQKLLKFAVSLSSETVVGISTLPPETRIGIACTSNKFANLVTEQLETFLPWAKNIPIDFGGNLAHTERFIRDLDAVILSPDSPLLDPALAGEVLERYRANGGKAIPFDYRMERGSMIYFEERVAQLLLEKYGERF